MPQATVICPPEHKHDGSTVCYITHKCRCDVCREWMNVRERNRNRLKAYGRWDHKADFVPAWPVRDHVRFLQSNGMGLLTVAEVAGVSKTTLRQLVYGREGSGGDQKRKGRQQVRIKRENAEKIMAVRIQLRRGAVVPAVGMHRRVQALVWQGWSISELARRLGVAPSDLNRSMRRPTVTAGRFDDVRKLFTELFGVAPPETNRREKCSATRSRNWAREQGWVSGMAWTNIDDPNESPAGPAGGRKQVDRELVLWLHNEGLSARQIADRAGCAERTVDRLRKEMGLAA